MIDETRGSVWFVTGSQHLYGEETLRQVHEHSRTLAEALNDSPAIPVAIVDREPLTDADAIRRVLAEASADEDCVGVIAWMHTFSPARMWIGGLNALRKPLLHLHTQFDRELPWGQIDMDYMNLNQSAHGDREFAYLESRMGISRKTVVGHWSDRLVQERIGTWIRAACGWQEAQRLRIARFGDNMRDVAVTEGDKVGAQITLGATVNGYGVDGLSDAVEHARDAAVAELLERYEDEYDLVPELRTDGARRESLRQAAQIEVGLRSVLLDGGFGAFTDTFEDLGRLRSASGHRRAAADGRRLRVRRRGRLEDGAAAARAQGDGATGSRAVPRSWRTTSTTWVPARRRCWAPTCWRSAPPSPRRVRPARSTRCRSAAATIPSASSSPRRRARR